MIMKCKLCGKKCDAISKDVSEPIILNGGIGEQITKIAVSDCCGSEIINNNYEFKTLRDEIAIEAMKIMLKVMMKKPDADNEKKYISDYCYSLSDEFMERRNK